MPCCARVPCAALTVSTLLSSPCPGEERRPSHHPVLWRPGEGVTSPPESGRAGLAGQRQGRGGLQAWSAREGGAPAPRDTVFVLKETRGVVRLQLAGTRAERGVGRARDRPGCSFPLAGGGDPDRSGPGEDTGSRPHAR